MNITQSTLSRLGAKFGGHREKHISKREPVNSASNSSVDTADQNHIIIGSQAIDQLSISMNEWDSQFKNWASEWRSMVGKFDFDKIKAAAYDLSAETSEPRSDDLIFYSNVLPSLSECGQGSTIDSCVGSPLQEDDTISLNSDLAGYAESYGKFAESN